VESAATIGVERSEVSVSPETLNQWTHGFGFLLSLIGAGVMTPAALSTASWGRAVGALVFCFTLVALYLASTLSHSFECPDRRRFYRMLDQVCIFLLCAGSYTPFILVHQSSALGWMMLTLSWTVALYGVYLRVRRPERTIGVTMFVLLGMAPVVSLPHLFEIGQGSGFALVLAGGAAYLGGLFFLLNDARRPYLHALWHLSTITGSACHFLFHLWYVVGPNTTA
jgi:hemolysin III